MPSIGGFKGPTGGGISIPGGGFHSGPSSSSSFSSGISDFFGFIFGIPVAAVAGAFYGFGLTFQVFFGFIVQLFTAPFVGPALTGVVIGVALVWVRRALHVKRDHAEPLLSAFFSRHLVEGDLTGFALHMLVDAAAGYFVYLAFAHVGLASGITSSNGTSLHTMALIIGGNGGGPFGPDGGFLTFLFVLIALILAGLLSGAMIGAAMLAALNTFSWYFVVSHAIQGASASVTYRVITRTSSSGGRLTFHDYIWESAGRGAREGAIVGVVAAIFLALVHL